MKGCDYNEKSNIWEKYVNIYVIIFLARRCNLQFIEWSSYKRLSSQRIEGRCVCMDNFLIGVLASLTATLIAYVIGKLIKKAKSHSRAKSDLIVEFKFMFKSKK
ncbi:MULTISPECIES: type I toxin-antitoxin system toxin [unclassified Clostridioides]|uniref:type I toxin-antitoxin system toxin n=2 Tax=Peptostreptococcaceae TaxID=186804 RepID=UPI0032F4F265